MINSVTATSNSWANDTSLTHANIIVGCALASRENSLSYFHRRLKKSLLRNICGSATRCSRDQDEEAQAFLEGDSEHTQSRIVLELHKLQGISQILNDQQLFVDDTPSKRPGNCKALHALADKMGIVN